MSKDVAPPVGDGKEKDFGADRTCEYRLDLPGYLNTLSLGNGSAFYDSFASGKGEGVSAVGRGAYFAFGHGQGILAIDSGQGKIALILTASFDAATTKTKLVGLETDLLGPSP